MTSTVVDRYSEDESNFILTRNNIQTLSGNGLTVVDSDTYTVRIDRYDSNTGNFPYSWALIYDSSGVLTNLANGTYNISSDRCKTSISGKYYLDLTCTAQDVQTGETNYQNLIISFTEAYGAEAKPRLYLETKYGDNPSGGSGPYDYVTFGSELIRPDLNNPRNMVGSVTRTYRLNGAAVQNPAAGYEQDYDNSAYDRSGWASSTGVSGNKIGLRIYIELGQNDYPQQDYTLDIRFQGTLTRTWEGTNHVIDGLDGDTAPDMSIQSTVTCEATKYRPGAASLQGTSNATTSAHIRINADQETLFASDTQSESTGTVIPYPEIVLTSTSALTVDATNFVPASADLVANFETVTDGVGVLIASADFVSSTTANFVGNMIFDVYALADYTWDDIDGGEPYTWDELTTPYNWDNLIFDQWGPEEQWDDWYFDVWERPFAPNAIHVMTATPSFILGAFLLGQSNFEFNENSAYNISGTASLSSDVDAEFTASGLIGGTSSMAPNTNFTSSGTMRYDSTDTLNVDVDVTPISSIKFENNIDLQFNSLVEADEDMIFGGLSNFISDSEFDLTPLLKLGGIAQIDITTIKFIVARLVLQADPYFTIKVIQELRKLNISEESRVYLINQEKRLNTIKAESRNILVPEETRRLKLRTPPFKNILSTPRTRGEK